jgi:hypothetical protein
VRAAPAAPTKVDLAGLTVLDSAYGFGIHAGNFGKLTIGARKLSTANVPFNQGDFWVDWLI